MLGQADNANRWDRLQEPRCSSSCSTGYLRLLAALDTGWTIQGLVGVRPAQRSNEPDEYRFTLVRSNGVEIRSLLLPYSLELALFISAEQLLLWGETRSDL